MTLMTKTEVKLSTQADNKKKTKIATLRTQEKARSRKCSLEVELHDWWELFLYFFLTDKRLRYMCVFRQTSMMY